MTHHTAIEQAVDRLSARKGSALRHLGEATVDRVSVRRFREALGLPPDPALGVPHMFIAHLLRRDADVSQDVRPVETVDAVLNDPVNGGTEVRFARRLRLGEQISGELVLADASLREGKAGKLAVVITEARYRDAQGEQVACLRQTMIYRGAAA